MTSLAMKSRKCLTDDIKCLESQLSALQERFDIIVNWIRSQYCELNGLPHIVIVAVLGDKPIKDNLESTRETFPLENIEIVKVECDNFDESSHVNADCKIEFDDQCETTTDKMDVDVLKDTEFKLVSRKLSVESLDDPQFVKAEEDDANYKNERSDEDNASDISYEPKNPSHAKGSRVVVKKTPQHLQDNKEKGMILTATEYKERIASLPKHRQSCLVCGKRFPTMPRLRRHEIEVHLTKEDALECRTEMQKMYALQAAKNAVKRTRGKAVIMTANEYEELIAPLPKKRPSCAICHRNYPTSDQLRRHELHCHLTEEERDKFRSRELKRRTEREALKRVVKSNVKSNVKTNVKPIVHKNVRKTGEYLQVNRDKGLIMTAGDYKELIASLPDDRLTCAICHKECTTSIQLRRHEVRVHLTKEDKRTFYRSISSRQTTTWDDDSEVTMCDLCNFPFRNIESHKKNHVPPGVTIRVEGSSRPHYRCLKCDLVVSNKMKYLSHLMNNEQCKVEKEETADNSNNDEQPIEKNFLCTHCGQNFNRMYTLKLHILALHANKRDFKCQFCDKRFVIEYNKKCHEKLHLGTSSVTCDLCGFSFRNKQILRKHIRGVHENRRPHQCPLCDKSFKTSTALKYHLNTHGNPNGRQRSLNRDTDPMHAAAKRRKNNGAKNKMLIASDA